MAETEVTSTPPSATACTAACARRRTIGDGQNNRSTQVTLGGSWKTLATACTLRVDHDQSLGGSNASADFPTRTVLGADYQLTQSVTLFADQEFTWGDE